MRVLFTYQFEKQLHKLKDKNLAKSIEAAILEVKHAASVSDITNIKKLKGSSSARIGNYRIGLYIIENTVEFACFYGPERDL